MYSNPPMIVAAAPSDNTSISSPSKKPKLHCTSRGGILLFKQTPDGLSYPALISTTEYLVLESDEDSEDDSSILTTLYHNNRVGKAYEGLHDSV